MPEQSLKEKTVNGTIWSGLENVTQVGVSFVVSIILARLLSPDDYGLIGIINIFTAICTALINGGFTSSLIRKKNVTEDDYNTVFITNMVMSLLLYAVIFLIAPLLAKFFERDELVALTRVTSLGMILGALAIVQQTRLTKKIDFKTQTKIALIASVFSGFVGIVMAFLGYGVWALVAQCLASHLFRTSFLWIYNKWIPKLFFSVVSFKELFGFGWKLMVSSLLNTIWQELYQVVVGKYYSPATLGQYTRAKQFSQLLSSNLTNVVQRVTYPVLSSIQDEKNRMVGAYRRIIKVTMFITAVGLFSLGAISEPLLYCLIGEKWHDAATYLPLICIVASLYPLHAINLNMLQVQGRSDLFLILEILKKIVGVVPLFVGALVGIMPMLYVSIVTGLIAFFMNSFWSGKYIGYSSWMQLKDIAPSYGVAIVICVTVWPLKFLPISNWIILPVQILVGAFAFLTICEISKLNEYEDMKELIRPLIKKIRR